MGAFKDNTWSSLGDVVNIFKPWVFTASNQKDH